MKMLESGKFINMRRDGNSVMWNLHPNICSNTSFIIKVGPNSILGTGKYCKCIEYLSHILHFRWCHLHQQTSRPWFIQTRAKHLSLHALTCWTAWLPEPNIGQRAWQASVDPSCYPYCSFNIEKSPKLLNYHNIFHRQTSGVTILGADPSIAKHIRKAILRSKSIFAKNPKKTFLAVTIGQPQDVDKLQQYGVTATVKDKVKHVSSRY